MSRERIRKLRDSLINDIAADHTETFEEAWDIFNLIIRSPYMYELKAQVFDIGVEDGDTKENHYYASSLKYEQDDNYKRQNRAEGEIA